MLFALYDLCSLHHTPSPSMQKSSNSMVGSSYTGQSADLETCHAKRQSQSMQHARFRTFSASIRKSADASGVLCRSMSEWSKATLPAGAFGQNNGSNSRGCCISTCSSHSASPMHPLNTRHNLEGQAAPGRRNCNASANVRQIQVNIQLCRCLWDPSLPPGCTAAIAGRRFSRGLDGALEAWRTHTQF